MARTFQDSRRVQGMTVSRERRLGALGAGLRRRAERERRTASCWPARHRPLRADAGARAPRSATSAASGIARALAMQPRFLLLDEPAAGLNEQEGRELAARSATLARRHGCGVLLVEHDMSVIFGVCDASRCSTAARRSPSARRRPIRADQAVIEAYFGTRGEGDARARDLHVQLRPHRRRAGPDARRPRGRARRPVGHNGAGKSSTVHAICGVLAPSRGEITFEGKSIRGKRARRHPAPRHLAGAGGPPHLRAADRRREPAHRHLGPLATAPRPQPTSAP